MAQSTLMAIFQSTQAAEAARAALIHEGFSGDEVVVSIDLTADGIAAEAPGQAYENQPTADDEFPDSLRDSFTPPLIEADTRQAQRMADIQTGTAVLTVSGSDSKLERAADLLQSLEPHALRRYRK